MPVEETKEQRRERQLGVLRGDLSAILEQPEPAHDETANGKELADDGIVIEGEQAPAAQRRGDPGIDMSDVLEKRIRAAIEDNTDEVIAELTDLRDRADQLMHAIRESSRLTIDGAVNHARKVSKAITAKKLIARALTEIESEFNGKANPVITQQK